MKKFKLLIGVATLFAITSAHAAAPMWTLTPITATTISVPSNGTAIIRYSVTNQSRITHSLMMMPIAGVQQAPAVVRDRSFESCSTSFTLAYKQSCVLVLNVTGSALSGNVSGGPQVCDQTGSLQCYQPTQADSLNITLTVPENTR